MLLLGYNPSLGDSFEIINADGGVNGTFNSVSLPGLDPGLVWSVSYGANNVVLGVLSNEDADFDENGRINGIDFLAWQRGFPTASGASHGDGDADADMDVDQFDLAIWQQQYGDTASVASLAVVPEPSTLLLAVLLLPWIKVRRHVC